MILNETILSHHYNIVIENNIFHNIYKSCEKYGKVLIISDDGVPFEYISSLSSAISGSYYYIFKHGEKSKNIKTILKIIDFMNHHSFNRNDLIIALGGGVVIDISAFVASIYKRGISYFSIPTTLLSQVDSCIGGKTGVDYQNIKNVIGTFYHPKKVFIDPILLQTLPKRHFNNGLIEAIKMGVICDQELFNLIKSEDIQKNLAKIIFLSLKNKLNIIKQDPYDHEIRQILNYGHTIGHAIESYFNMKKVLHGEAVAYGMLLETQNSDVKNQLQFIFNKIKLKKLPHIDMNCLEPFVRMDKKINDEYLFLPVVEKIGYCKLEKINIDDFLTSIGGETYE